MIISLVFAYVVRSQAGQLCAAVSISQINWKPDCLLINLSPFLVTASLAIFKRLLHYQINGVSQESASELE